MLKSLLIGILALSACTKSTPSSPEPPTAFPITTSMLTEASGMAESYKNPGYLWIQEDSNTPAQLNLLSTQGVFLKSIPIKNIVNRDWEDLCIAKGPDPSLHYIYIAETGDNTAQYRSYALYRFPEPAKEAIEINAVETISFQYPDGSHDAEAILIDPLNNDIYIITKRENQAQVYQLTYPYSLTATNTLKLAGQLPYTMVVSAAITPDQKGIAIKTYQRIYYYPRTNTETIMQTLMKTPDQLNYIPEQQGEAICFSNNNLGYYTISERVTEPVTLYYYKR